ncbi:MAG TPA: hypothetical protein VHZ24_06165 [Pirellulales bacterium]|jgi:hypothetical protein|nr:hypothetical protein [Pirellulales bacterium]
MAKVDSIAVLNRLAAIEHRSLAMYLVDACPWRRAGDEKEAVLLENIVTDQRVMVERIAELVLGRGGVLDLGEYPMDFTDTHDLSLDYLMRELLRLQKLMIPRLERLAELLESVPHIDRPAHDLALEVLGSERAHLEAIQEICGQPAG